jgi:hypothetical protein
MKKLSTSKLAFNKAGITELNHSNLMSIQGGAMSGIRGTDDDTNPCSGCVCDPILTKITIIRAN